MSYAQPNINGHFLGTWATSQSVCQQGFQQDSDSMITIAPTRILHDYWESALDGQLDTLHFNEKNLISGSMTQKWQSEGEEGEDYTSFAFLLRDNVLYDLNFHSKKYLKCK